MLYMREREKFSLTERYIAVLLVDLHRAVYLTELMAFS